MGTTYLIDFENIGNRWAEILAGASRGDTAVLFYSDNAPKAMLDQLEKAERRGIALKFRHCACGRNGLDFQLASELGYLIGAGTGTAYAIVSDDAGYDVLADYWKTSGESVSRLPCKPAPAEARKPVGQAVVDCLDGPMTDAGLARADRHHVLGCAKAAMQGARSPEDRWERFRSDTARIKGRKGLARIESAIGTDLDGLFRSEI